MSLSRVSSIVTTGWLKQQLVSWTANTTKAASSPLRVLDTSWLPEPHVNGYTEFFRQGHIPGALYFDLKKLSPKRPDSPIDCPVPDSNYFQDYVENLGITNDSHVVVYDQLNARSSIRSWFLFRLFGHDKVSVLDGGMKKWQADGYETTKEEPRFGEKSAFTVKFRPELLLDYQSMLKIVSNRSHAIVDSRPGIGGFYISDEDASGGHMPGAKSIPFDTFFNKDGTFKSQKDLEALFSAVDVDLSKPIAATCLRGMTACAVALAAYNLGRTDVPVYNGSWLEWSVIADPKNIVREKKSLKA